MISHDYQLNSSHGDSDTCVSNSWEMRDKARRYGDLRFVAVETAWIIA